MASVPVYVRVRFQGFRYWVPTARHWKTTLSYLLACAEDSSGWLGWTSYDPSHGETEASRQGRSNPQSDRASATVDSTVCNSWPWNESKSILFNTHDCPEQSFTTQVIVILPVWHQSQLHLKNSELPSLKVCSSLTITVALTCLPLSKTLKGVKGGHAGLLSW